MEQIRSWTGVALCLGLSTSGIGGADWQSDRLMRPSDAQLAAERRGHVVIYDGLDARLVNLAMDANFERIQNMMFIRIHHLPPPGAGGEVLIEDDGCD